MYAESAGAKSAWILKEVTGRWASTTVSDFRVCTFSIQGEASFSGFSPKFSVQRDLG